MIIWNRPFPVECNELLDDLKIEAKSKLKKDVFRIINNGGKDWFIQCPNINGHGGEIERTPSCAVQKESGVVHCFGCDYKASMPELISFILELRSPVEGYRWLLKKYTIQTNKERPKLKLETIARREDKHYLDESILDKYSFDHPYMYQRGLNDTVIDLLELGYDKEFNAITIPMRDYKDRLLFIKKRPIKKGKFRKYHIDSGMEKRDVVYGLNIIRRYIHRVPMIFLCEGEFDVASMYVAKKFGAGTQGDRLFDEQIKSLIKVAKGIPICLTPDNDKAGMEFKKKLIPELRSYFPLYEPIWPDFSAKDPNDLLKMGLLEDMKVRPIRRGQ